MRLGSNHQSLGDLASQLKAPAGQLSPNQNPDIERNLTG